MPYIRTPSTYTLSEFYNDALHTEYVAAVGMLRNHHLKAETILKLNVHSQFLKYYYSRAKVEIFT